MRFRPVDTSPERALSSMLRILERMDAMKGALERIAANEEEPAAAFIAAEALSFDPTKEKEPCR